MRLNYVPTNSSDTVFGEFHHKIFYKKTDTFAFSLTLFQTHSYIDILEGYRYCGWYHFKFNVKKNGVFKTYENDIYFDWKTTPPFDYTIIY